jgi:hypothetical protein
MHCENCGATDAVGIRIGYTNGVKWEICDRCSDIKFRAMPDVYFGNKSGIQTDPNLCDKTTGKEIPFSSKREKAAIMKHLGLRQSVSAEKQHGARNEMYLHRKKYI